ncbi:MAG TPA: SDR family oxidoreductase [bacterium]|nr:SDR family oxidoreductase [bacterium]
MTILITGASGFLGANLAHDLAQTYSVIGTYRNEYPPVPGVDWVSMDLTCRDSVRQVVENCCPTVAVHCAAQANTERAQTHFDEAVQINRDGTCLLVESLPRDCYLIHISTEHVYNASKSWFLETDPPGPVNQYGRTKLLAEQEVLHFEGDWIILRMALLYGGRKEYRLCFSDRIYSQMKQGKPVSLFMDEFRTPLHVSDVAAAVQVAMERHPAREIFNLGGPDRLSRAEFGAILAEETGLDPGLIQRISVDSSPTIAPRPRDLSLNSDKIRSCLGIHPLSVREGIRRAYSTCP